jgi:vancomycin resistance protein YoaR
VPLEPRPYIKDGTTYAPLRQLAEALGATVEWCGSSINVYPPVGPPVRVKYSFVLGSYTITFNALEAKSPSFFNACRAGQYLNGKVIAAGEIFSFNAAVGPRIKTRGFIPGIIFVGSTKVPETGGGVCRTATLLHNAVMAAGLEVVERHRHSQPVTYVPPGKDATVYYGSLDYRFRNNGLFPVRLEFQSAGPSITLKIWETG